MRSIVTLDGIDQAISGLQYRNENALKYRLIHVIRQYYSDESSVGNISEIGINELVKKLWETGDNPSIIRNRKKNFNSVKASINSELKKLYDEGKNPEGVIIGRSNVFEMSDEAKNQILESFAYDASGEQSIPMGQMVDVLKVINNMLKNADHVQDADDIDVKQGLEQLKDIIRSVARKVGVAGSGELEEGLAIGETGSEGGAGTGGGEGHDKKVPLQDFMEGVEIQDGEDSTLEEPEADEELEEVEDDPEDDEIEDIPEEEDPLEELEEDEDVEEIEGDIDDGEVEELPEEDEPLEELEEDEDEEVEAIEDEVDDEELEDLSEEDEDLEEIVNDIEDEEIEDLEQGVDSEEIDMAEGLEEAGGQGAGQGENDGLLSGDSAKNKVDEEDEEGLTDSLEETDSTGELEDVEEILEELDEEPEELLDEDDLEEEAEEDEIEDDPEDEPEDVVIEEDLEDTGLGVEIESAAQEDGSAGKGLDEEGAGQEPPEEEELPEELEDDEEVEEIEDEVEDEEAEELSDEEELSEELEDDEEVEEIEDEVEDDEIEDLDEDGDDDIDIVDDVESPAAEELYEEVDDEQALNISLDELEEYLEKGFCDEEGIKTARSLAEAFNKALAARDRHYNQYLLIPEGIYTIGNSNSCNGDQKEKRVQLDEFYFGKFPVTNALFEIFIEKTGYVTTAERSGFGTVYRGRYQENVDKETGMTTLDWSSSLESREVEGACWYQPAGPGSTLYQKRSHPVVQVSREDAMAFAAWTGKRLPTEEEWEAASRTKKGYIFPCGNNLESGICNMEKEYIGDTTPVDKYKDTANESGIADTLGNVFEWTLSNTNGSSGSSTDNTVYIAKGGSWVSSENIDLSSRLEIPADLTSNILGFRCLAI